MELLPQILVNALITGSLYALIAVGFSLTYGVLKILNFSHCHLMMAGAYLFYFFFAELEFGLVLSALCSATASIILASIVFFLFIRPFEGRSILLPLVSTLGCATILESLVAIFFGVNVKSLSAGWLSESIEIGSIFVTPLQLLIISTAIIISVVLAIILQFTPFGRQVRAVSERATAAESIGITPVRVRFTVFSAAVLLTILGGILVGFESNLTPTMGQSFILKAVAASVLGGLGNVWGTLAGSFILGFIENIAVGIDIGGFSLPASYKDSFAFFVILFVLLLRPNGIFSMRRRSV